MNPQPLKLKIKTFIRIRISWTHIFQNSKEKNSTKTCAQQPPSLYMHVYLCQTRTRKIHIDTQKLTPEWSSYNEIPFPSPKRGLFFHISSLNLGFLYTPHFKDLHILTNIYTLTMSQNGSKLMPNLDQQSTKLLNLTVLQRIDPFVEEILITAAHVTFYEFNIDLSQWVRYYFSVVNKSISLFCCLSFVFCYLIVSFIFLVG